MSFRAQWVFLVAERSRTRGKSLKIGYVGTLDYSKFFEDFVDWASEIPSEAMPIKLIGDGPNREDIAKQANNVGNPKLFDFVGYSSSVTRRTACFGHISVSAKSTTLRDGRKCPS